MFVGVCRITLSIPGNDSLKGKRSVVRQVVDKVRHRFNVAIAEVDEMDRLTTAVLGFAVVSNEHGHANSMVDSVVSFVAGAARAIVVDRQTEILSMRTLYPEGLDEP